MIRFIALDPGKVTGWSLWGYDPASEHAAVRLDYGLVSGGVEGFIRWWNIERPVPVSLVVCEKFELDQRTEKPDLTPTYIEGALRALCGVPLVWQPTGMKRQVSDEKLKQYGLWLAGSNKKIRHVDARDVNDSQIHALAYLKLRHRPTAMRFWPEPLVDWENA